MIYDIFALPGMNGNVTKVIDRNNENTKAIW